MVVMHSGTIGIREAKAHLSRLVADARNGGEWLITDHGVPVARLSTVADPNVPLDERIRRLENWGWIERAHAQPAPYVVSRARRPRPADRTAHRSG